MKSIKIIAMFAAAILIPLGAMAANVEANKSHPKGSSAEATASTRTVKITQKAKYVNVRQGETVKFVVGDQTFTWYFDTYRNRDNFALSDIAPSDINTHGVRVYVAPNPLYQN